MPGQPASCCRKYVREEALEAQFAKLLGCFHFDDEVLAWVREALHASHADQRAPGGDQRLQAEHARLGERINAMYIDKLDGKIGGDFFDRFAGEWGAAALAAGDRPARKGGAVLHGRGRADSRTGAQRATAVRGRMAKCVPLSANRLIY